MSGTSFCPSTLSSVDQQGMTESLPATCRAARPRVQEPERRSTKFRPPRGRVKSMLAGHMVACKDPWGAGE